MFEKNLNDRGEVVCVKRVSDFIKSLIAIISILIFIGIGLCVAVFVHEMIGEHSIIRIIVSLGCAAFATNGLVLLLRMRNPVELILSQKSVTVKRGCKVFTASWDALGPFEWESSNLCLHARIIKQDGVSGIKGHYYTIPPSFEKEDVPSVLQEMAAIQKLCQETKTEG